MLREFLHSNRKIARAFLYVINRPIIRDIVPEKIFIKTKYYFEFGKHINLNDPKTFNEKMQWLKLYDRNPEYISMVDKYQAKEYVKQIIGEEHIIPTLGIWDNFEEIDFGRLPEQFVLKCTHDSGSIVICKEKKSFNKESARKILQQGLNRNPFYWGHEWPYRNVKPRIIAEKYLTDSPDKSGKELDKESLSDYKFFCFNGKVKCFKVDFDRFTNHRANYYDEQLHILPFGEQAFLPDYGRLIIFPKNIDQMIYFAEKLAKNIPFVRVDFYNVDGCIFFGEMTFYPASGYGKFTDDLWDIRLGSWIKLPQIRGVKK